MGRTFSERLRKSFRELAPRRKAGGKFLVKHGLLKKAAAPPSFDRLSPKALEARKKIFSFLFVKDEFKTKPERLTVVVPKHKEKLFEFLKAYTQWDSVGKWRRDVEGNTVITVVFYDYPNDGVGKELEKALREYNEAAVGEKVPAFWTEPVSETSISPPEGEGPVPRELIPYRRALSSSA
ncbi:hypothetical protein [Candidatus Hecatella orcuttiae]|uniref:hypothetical protein n=1 Tax=Candidatus Hecatella orcuttiae TaxID=1935119 RepID=UPI002867D56E|nr:hypothetical protein [Candidatus Hecatella orcuttiae]